MFQITRKGKLSRVAVETGAPRKLNSIAGLLVEREFTGDFQAKDATYKFAFVPTVAAVKDGKLELTGRFTVRNGRGAPRTADDVRATLIATQGGIGTSPTRRQLLSGTADNSNVSSTDQKLEQAKAPETTQQSPEPGRQTKLTDSNQDAVPTADATDTITTTQSTGESSFVGVMYLRLQPLDNRALGISVDMSKVQLNARIVATDDVARDLLFLYSGIVAAVYGEQPDERNANEYLQELNRVLKSTGAASLYSSDEGGQQVAHSSVTSSGHDHLHFEVLHLTE